MFWANFPGLNGHWGGAIGPQNGPFVAIGRSGGSEIVDQLGSRLDQGIGHNLFGLVC